MRAPSSTASVQAERRAAPRPTGIPRATKGPLPGASGIARRMGRAWGPNDQVGTLGLGGGAGGPHRRGAGAGLRACADQRGARLLRAPTGLAVLAQPRRRSLARAGGAAGRAAAGGAQAQGQVRHGAADPAGRHLCAGRGVARGADLHRQLPVRVAQHRGLVRRPRPGRARCRPQPRSWHARSAGHRPGRQDAGRRRPPRRDAWRATPAGAGAVARAAGRAGRGTGRRRAGRSCSPPAAAPAPAR